LLAVVLAAAAIRLPLALRITMTRYFMLGHTSVVSWEWREGMRGWLLPTPVAGPVAIGGLWPGGMGAFVVPRLIAAVASLSIVVLAWMYGARVTRAEHGVR